MDNQRGFPSLQYAMPTPNEDHAPLRVDPKYPLPSFLPPSRSPPVINGVARVASRKRRPSGMGTGKAPIERIARPPVAPEVPKAPPVSYRPPHSNEDADSPIGTSPDSFAERARVLTGDSFPTDQYNIGSEPVAQRIKPERRASLNRPIGGVYSEIAQQRRDSYPSPPSGPTSPRRSSIPTSPQQYNKPELTPENSRSISAGSRPNTYSNSLPLPASSRQISAGIVQPLKKEWAADRSPLQKLEVKLGDISKEEKRARVERAEQKLRESQAQRRRDSRDIDSAMDPTTSQRMSVDGAGARSRRYPDLGSQTKGASAEYPKGDLTQRDIETQKRGATRISQSDGHSKPSRITPSQKLASDGVAAGTQEPLARDRSNRTSKTANDAQYLRQQQPERGVRFQNDEAPEDAIPQPNNIGMSAKRERLRQDPSTMAKQSRSTEILSEQQELYNSRATKSQNNTSAVTYGGTPDPVPKDAVMGSGQGSLYEIPPQTASGMQARQKVGFGRPQDIPDLSAHRKHHLSDVLHRGHNHAVHLHEQSSSRPRYLEEWKQGGTARLTAADFAAEKSLSTDQGAWWEDKGVGNRRSSRRSNSGVRQDARSSHNGAQDDNGKAQSRSRSESFQVSWKDPLAVVHTRPYVTSQHPRPSVKSRLRSHVYHHPFHVGRESVSGLSSAYSYSCPNLADHDPAHNEHICEPYLSNKLLTQSMRSIRIRPVPGIATFSPPLYLKCGPLLRYTGIRRDRLQTKTRAGLSSSERETWRGSVMIITSDIDSIYNPPPTLRLFPEPMDLLPSPLHKVDEENGRELPSEYIDPVAGLPKLSRTGKTVYVKPVDDLDQGIDLSRVEDDDGLFEETRTAAVPTSYGTPDFRPGRPHQASSNPQQGGRDGTIPKKGQRVRGVRLHAERGVTFWRFNLEVELGSKEARIAYSINDSPSVGFWVPARGHSMNVMFHSCNGFSMSVNPDDFSGPDPLWRDVLNSHQTRPFHVMIGGGDQIYNDSVMSQSPLFREWLEINNLNHKHEADFTPSMLEELETFYLERYSMWFSQGFFGMANSQIPMVNMWDDHDIIDGFGSYPHDFMSTPVFCGVGAVAFKYYMLFQHQSIPDEGPADEPSWVLGAAPGPYIGQFSRSIFLSLGKHVAFLGLDCRTERMREEILSEASYELVFDRCRREIIEGETKHLIVLLGVPIAYPRLVWLENLLTSKVMDPIKYLGKAGMLGAFLNKFDGGVEILDDLDDHWTAKNHKQERNWFVQELQELAAEKSVRVTILGGDVHLAAIGQFYSNPKLKVPKDRDHRYMANIISSAIVNTPPPEMMGDILNKRNKTHHLDRETDEDMIPMFTHDVDGKSRNNKRLLPRRNWCSIREYHPGSTPPPTPPDSEAQTLSDESPPPLQGRLQRTLSLTRDDMRPGNLLRRLSGRGPPPSNDYPPSNTYDSGDPPSPNYHQGDGYYPREPKPPQLPTPAPNGNSLQRHSSAPIARPGDFHRRPTNMSEMAAKKGDLDGTSGRINLEQGLDVVLNCEVNQKDPAGITVPYRLLIPALFYGGPGDANTEPYRRKSIISRLGSIRGKRRGTLASGQGKGNWGGEESLSGAESEGGQEEARPRRWSFGLNQRRQYRDQTPPQQREFEDRPLQQRQFQERPQPQRQFEERPRQQQTKSEPQPHWADEYHIARQGGRGFGGPTSPQPATIFSKQQRPIDQYDGQSQDTSDQAALEDSSPSQQQSGYLGRRLGIVDRLLGKGNARSSSVGNGGGGKSFSARQRSADNEYEEQDIGAARKSSDAAYYNDDTGNNTHALSHRSSTRTNNGAGNTPVYGARALEQQANRRSSVRETPISGSGLSPGAAQGLYDDEYQDRSDGGSEFSYEPEKKGWRRFFS